MNAPINELVALAEQHGAVFKQMPTGTWTAHRNNIPGVWGTSQVDAAARFLEEIGVEPTEPAAILAIIRHQYRPYDQRPEFDEGFADYRASRRREKYDGVKAQAYDRGANAAMLYARALVRLDKPEKPAVDGRLPLTNALAALAFGVALALTLANRAHAFDRAAPRSSAAGDGGSIFCADERSARAKEACEEEHQRLRGQLHKEMRDWAERCFHVQRGEFRRDAECQRALDGRR